MDLGSLSDEELQHLKEISWDDWNFGSGKKLSLELVNQIEEEQERRKTTLSPLNWHEADKQPENPKRGDAYFDTKTETAWMYDGGHWCQFSGPGV